MPRAGSARGSDGRLSTAVPKAAVVGTGVIGTIYASILLEQGWSVDHLVRQSPSHTRPERVNVDLWDLRKGHERRSRRSYEYTFVEALPAEAELVLVPVRLYQLEGALRIFSGMPGDVTAVIFTAIWTGPEPLDAALPNGNYVLADALAGGEISGDRLTATIKPSLPLGAVHPFAEPRAAKVSEIFSGAGLAPTHEHDILHWHWLQYALNAAMWPALVEAGTARAVVSDRVCLRRMMATLREALRVCEARGVAVGRYPETRVFLDESAGVTSRVRAWMIRKAYGLSVVHSEYHRRCMLHALKDPKEIATAYSAVLATGRDLGCDMTAFESYGDTIARFRQAAL